MATTQFQAPRGTQDILPEDAPYWTYVEAETRRQAHLANYGEIRTPTFEYTAVFMKGVGDATDVVEHEMYTFLDKGGESLTLRPEATAAIVRAYLQGGMSSRPQPVKLFTLLTAFRHAAPQRGRFREFNQIDFEVIGEADPMVDAELVALQWRLYTALGLRDLSLEVNSIGDRVCRPDYIAKLADYFRANISGLCEDCRRRLEINPLRLLDEKKPECQAVLNGAPHSADNLCGPCLEHYRGWLGYLDAAHIPYTVNPRLVRGLDYYTRSVWEILPQVAGAQSALGGGGRYDGLAEVLGGRATPGVGWAGGIERIILELKDQQAPVPPADRPCVYFAYQTDAGKRQAFQLAERLRAAGMSADVAFGDRKLGKQLGSADRTGAQLAVILGEDELANHSITLKDLRTGEQKTIPEDGLLAELRPDHGQTV
jgi:histidyl-tRNA synthetase